MAEETSGSTTLSDHPFSFSAKSIATVSLSGTLPEKLEKRRRPGSTVWSSLSPTCTYSGLPAFIRRVKSDLGL